jgi:hypothetical protein
MRVLDGDSQPFERFIDVHPSCVAVHLRPAHHEDQRAPRFFRILLAKVNVDSLSDQVGPESNLLAVPAGSTLLPGPYSRATSPGCL